MYYVYILRSIKFNRFYIGQTKDLQKRIEHHNSNQARWTKRYQPWELAYSECYSTRSDAMKRERYLKKRKDSTRIKELLNKVESR